MEAGSDDPGASPPPVLLPKHTILLSHSGKEKALVQELNHALLGVHHSPFFDQNRDCLPMGERFPPLILEAAKQCQVAVIILSIGYLTSKWPMLELVEFHKSMEADDRKKLLPVFYDVTPDQLRERLDSFRIDWLNLFSGKEEVDCEKAIRELKVTNGLIFEKYGNDTVKFREAVMEEICKLLPPPKPFDESAIQGRDRLCKQIIELFKEEKGIHYLGIYGDRGSGKSKLCQAMCNHYNVEYWGKSCIVELEVEKAIDSRAAKKKREERLRSATKQLVGLNKNMSRIYSEEQGQNYLKRGVLHQRVFLVVENVSQSNIEEAEFYVNLGYARGSRVLVTSRTKRFLESVFRGQQYSDFCHPVPGLNAEEAAQLVLTKAAPNKKKTDLDNYENGIVDDWCNRCLSHEQYHPSSLIALANYLRNIGDNIIAWASQLESVSFRESNESDAMFRYILMDYDNLSNPAKLIFLDLALFSVGMHHTHLDYECDDLEWDEHSNFTNVITYISYLHNLTPKQAQTKVEELQGMNFLKESTTEIAVPDYSEDFARWLIEKGDDDRDEKKWCVLYEPEEEATGYGCDRSVKWPDVSARTALTRVSLVYVTWAHNDLQNLQKFTMLVYLELIQVADMLSLDLQGFSSLRVMKVQECEDLEKIICTCNSSSNAHSFCYQNQRHSGCLPNLRVVQLDYLPSLETASFPSHCFNLETLWFFECFNLSSLPNLQFCKKLKRLRLPCGDFKGFQGLSSNVALTELAFDWDPETVRNFTEDMSRQLLKDVMNLTNLTVLDIVDERNVYEWIPPGIVMNVGRLVHLTFLDLSCATTITEIEGLQNLRHLTALGLYGCCELLKLPHLANFVKLKRLCIGHCHKLVESLREDDLVRYAEFHPWGDYCSFGEHECLLPSDEDGICKVCDLEEWDEINGSHDIESTLPLNKVRGMLISIEAPLAAISAAILKNMDENRKIMKRYIERQDRRILRPEDMTIKEEILISEALKHPRTVCNSSTCKGRICHDNCKPTETLAGGLVGGIINYLTGDEYVFCKMLSLRSRKCKKCGCNRKYHTRMSHEVKTVVQERVDEALRKVLAESQNEYEQMKSMTEALEEREEAYKMEMEIVVKAAALFNGFLRQNSIVSYNTATREYLEDQVEKKQASEDNSTQEGRARIAELKKLLADYTRRVEKLKSRSGRSSGRDVTIEDVQGELQKLFDLPRDGDSLRILIDDQEKEYKSVVTRANEIQVKVPHAEGIRTQAAVLVTRALESLSERGTSLIPTSLIHTSLIPTSLPKRGTSIIKKMSNMTIKK